LIKDEVLELNRKGATILFSTHRMESVEELCDSIALLDKAKKILDGKMKDIKNSYRNATYLIEYTGHKLDFDGSQPFTIDEEVVAAEDSTTIKIKLKADASANDVLKYLIPKTSINMLQEVIPTMNEIFIEKVSKLN
jgi:ABC-2 type transport system ATP-binding protein